MEWKVILTGPPEDLGALANNLQSSELTLTEENNQFVIRSTTFDPTADASVIRQQALKLIGLMDGAAALVLGHRQSIGLGSVCRVNNDGRNECYITISDGIKLREAIEVTFTRADGTETIISPAECVSKWLAVAREDNTVEKVLKYLSRTLDWATLYNIHETIRYDVGGEGEIQAARWATKKEQNRFTHTANNYSSLKEAARHAREDWEPPANPMPLSEAESLIKSIALAWLNQKCGP